MAQDIMGALKEHSEQILSTLGKNAQEARDQTTAYLKEIEPEVEAAVNNGDLMTLKFIADRSEARAAAILLDFTDREQVAVVAGITGVVFGFIKAALLA